MTSGCETDGGAKDRDTERHDTERRGAKARDGAKGGGRREAREPVVLVTLYDPVEAEIIVAKLRSAGIEVYDRHEAISVVYGLTVDGFGQHDILVRPEDLADAWVALEQTP
jgi:hypothetical protein